MLLQISQRQEQLHKKQMFHNKPLRFNAGSLSWPEVQLDKTRFNAHSWVLLSFLQDKKIQSTEELDFFLLFVVTPSVNNPKIIWLLVSDL